MTKRAVALFTSILLCISSMDFIVFAEENPDPADTAEEITEQSEVTDTTAENEEMTAVESVIEEADEVPAENESQVLPEAEEVIPAEAEPAVKEDVQDTAEEEAAVVITEEEETGDLKQAGTGSISGKVCWISGEAATFNYDIRLYLHNSKGQKMDYYCVLPKGTSAFTFTGVPDGEYFVGNQISTERDSCSIAMNSEGKKAVVKNGNAVTGYNAYANWTYDMWARGTEQDLVINKNGTNSFWVVTSGNTMQLVDVKIYDMQFNVLKHVNVTRIDIDENGLQYVFLDPAPVRALAPGDYQFMLGFRNGGSFKDFKIVNEKTGYNMEFVTEGSKSYWFEGGVKQGTYDDPNGVVGDGTIRGREIMDPATQAWYWLDAVYDGAVATNKEVWMPYIFQNEKTMSPERIEEWRQFANTYTEDPKGVTAEMGDQLVKAIEDGTGKWVRYDENGKMLKGWVTIEGDLANLYPTQAGNTYYYDYATGLMAKGWTKIGGKDWHFDEITGVLD